MKRPIDSKTIWIAVLVAVGAGIAAAIDAYHAGTAWPYLLMLVGQAIVHALLRFVTGEPLSTALAPAEGAGTTPAEENVIQKLVDLFLSAAQPAAPAVAPAAPPVAPAAPPQLEPVAPPVADPPPQG